MSESRTSLVLVLGLVIALTVTVVVAASAVQRGRDWEAIAAGRATRISDLESAISASETDVGNLTGLIDELSDRQATAEDLLILATDESTGRTDLSALTSLAVRAIEACSTGATDLSDVMGAGSDFEEAEAQTLIDSVLADCARAEAAGAALVLAAP